MNEAEMIGKQQVPTGNVPGSKGLIKLGGISFIVSGMLFFATYIFILLAGPNPTNGSDIIAWASSNKLMLALSDETLIFAAVFLIPAVAALYIQLASEHRAKAVVGCGLMAVTIPVLAIMDLLLGRLVYPVAGMSLNSPVVAEFVLTMYYGGLHLVYLMMCVAVIVLSWAMGSWIAGKFITYLGIVTGIIYLLAAYPDVIGSVGTMVSQIVFLALFLVVGWKLYGMPRSDEMRT